MRARRSSFFVGSAVIALVSAIAASSPAAPSVPAEAGESSVLPAPGDYSVKSCLKGKLLCGIKGDNVCCDNESECCLRKPGKTYCAKKSSGKCGKQPDG